MCVCVCVWCMCACVWCMYVCVGGACACVCVGVWCMYACVWGCVWFMCVVHVCDEKCLHIAYAQQMYCTIMYYTEVGQNVQRVFPIELNKKESPNAAVTNYNNR